MFLLLLVFLLLLSLLLFRFIVGTIGFLCRILPKRCQVVHWDGYSENICRKTINTSHWFYSTICTESVPVTHSELFTGGGGRGGGGARKGEDIYSFSDTIKIIYFAFLLLSQGFHFI